MSNMTNFILIVLEIFFICLTMFSIQTFWQTDFFHFDLSNMNNISLVPTEGQLATSDKLLFHSICMENE